MIVALKSRKQDDPLVRALAFQDVRGWIQALYPLDPLAFLVLHDWNDSQTPTQFWSTKSIFQ